MKCAILRRCSGERMTAVILKRFYYSTWVLLWPSSEIQGGGKRVPWLDQSCISPTSKLATSGFIFQIYHLITGQPGPNYLNFSELSFLVNKIKINSSLIGWS